MTQLRSYRRVRADPEAKISVGQDSLVLIGPPESLSGDVTLRNDSSEHLLIRDFAIKSDRKSSGLLGSRLAVRSRLDPGTERSASVSASLPSTIAPGEYAEKITIGGKDVPVRIVVQPMMKVDISPHRLHFVGIRPGLEHHAELLIVNRGNVPVQIPNLRHSTALDVDTICRNLSLAVRDKGHEGSTATLDAFVQGLRRDMAGWLELTVEEAWEIVEPGKIISIHVTLKLPDDVDANRAYRGEFRLLGRLVSYSISRTPVVKRTTPGRAGRTAKPKRTARTPAAAKSSTKKK